MNAWTAGVPPDVSLTRVDPDSADLDADLRVLTDAERGRAAAMLSEHARRSFVAARAALRRMLADEIGCTTSEIVLTHGAFGCPVLAHPAVAMRFSVAHSRGMALLATSRTHVVGVDLERADRAVPASVRDIAFLPDEHALLDATDPHERARAALRMWVRKEALAKADGRGLRLVAAGIDVTYPQVRIEGLDGAPRSYRLDDLDVSPSHLAAIASTPARWAAVGQSSTTSRSASRVVGAASP